jgi:DNA-binding beta-propeller fold protein YncE
MLARTARLLLLVSLLLLGCAAPQPAVRDRSATESPNEVPALPDSLVGVRRPHEILINRLNGHAYICGSPDDAGVLVLDATTGDRIGFIPERGARGLWLNPVTNRLYIRAGTSWEDRGITVIDCSADTVVRRLVRNWLWPQCVNPTAGKIYASFNYFWHATVAIIEQRTSRVAGLVTIGPVGKWSDNLLLYNPASNAAYCTGDDGSVILAIDGSTNRVRARIRHRDGLYARCVDSIENKLYASSPRHGDSSLAVIDCRANRIAAWLPIPRYVDAIVCAPRDKKVYCAYGSGGINQPGLAVIDAVTNRVTRTLPLPGLAGSLVFDSTRNRLYCASQDSGWVCAVDCESDSLVGTIVTGGRVSPAALHESVGRLYCLDWENGSASVIDCSSLELVGTLHLAPRAGEQRAR